MLGDIALLIVRLSGGWWAFREKFRGLKRRSLRQRLMLPIYYAYLYRYGAFIGHSSVIASEPCFPHNLYGIFIAGNARLGRNCVIFHQVTIGSNAIPGSKTVGAPTLGDNVYVGVGAKIIGKVTVGNNCRIGANCVVTTDVPDNTVVVLPPPRVMVRDHPLDNRYYRWSPEGPIYFDAGSWIRETDPAAIEALKNAF